MTKTMREDRLTEAAPRPASGIHVCMLCPGTFEGAGGVGRFVEALSTEIRRLDATVEIEILNTRGDGHIAMSPVFYAKALARIIAAMLAGRNAVLHVNVGVRGSALRKYFVVLLAAARRVPVVLHLHGARFDTFYATLPPVLQRRVRAMFGRAQRIVVHGPTLKRLIARTLGADEGCIEVVPNGVPRPASPAPDALSLPSGDGSQAHIVFLGRLGTNKGVPELLAAFASANLKGLAWRATLAGDGDPRPFIDEAAKLGIAHRLTFPGWLGKAASDELLRGATVFVLPSHTEGLPMAVVEALAHGIPVVTTPVGAIPDYLADGESALFVQPGDPAGLAQALARLVASRSLREHLAVRGHAVFASHFDIAEIARRFIAMYAELSAPSARRIR